MDSREIWDDDRVSFVERKSVKVAVRPGLAFLGPAVGEERAKFCGVDGG